MNNQSDTRFSVPLSDSEVRALEWLAESLDSTPEDALKDIVLRGLQVTAGIAREGAEQGLAEDQAAERLVRGYIASLPESIETTPDRLRLIGKAYLRVADQLDREQELRRRQDSAERMTALRERIRERGGAMPDVNSLLDEDG